MRFKTARPADIFFVITSMGVPTASLKIHLCELPDIDVGVLLTLTEKFLSTRDDL